MFIQKSKLIKVLCQTSHVFSSLPKGGSLRVNKLGTVNDGQVSQTHQSWCPCTAQCTVYTGCYDVLHSVQCLLYFVAQYSVCRGVYSIMCRGVYCIMCRGVYSILCTGVYSILCTGVYSILCTLYSILCTGVYSILCTGVYSILCTGVYSILCTGVYSILCTCVYSIACRAVRDYALDRGCLSPIYRDPWKQCSLYSFFLFTLQSVLYFVRCRLKADMEFGTHFARTEVFDNHLTPKYTIRYFLVYITSCPSNTKNYFIPILPKVLTIKH